MNILSGKNQHAPTLQERVNIALLSSGLSTFFGSGEEDKGTIYVYGGNSRKKWEAVKILEAGKLISNEITSNNLNYIIKDANSEVNIVFENDLMFQSRLYLKNLVDKFSSKEVKKHTTKFEEAYH